MRRILHGVRFAGLCAAVPARVETVEESGYDSPEARRRFSGATGVLRRRICPPDLFFSDLAVAAAERLLCGLGWDRSEVEALLVVTQSGDVSYPSTATILQHRLGLSTGCASFDINLGCSGFPYGIFAAARMLGPGNASKVLLLIGDAAGKPNPASPRAPLFGDAAAAVALERDTSASPMQFFLHTDGSGWDYIMERRSGGKPGLDRTALPSAEDALGRVYFDTQYQMKGADVFNFSVRIVPPTVRTALQSAEWTAESVDAFVFHQASRLINETLGKSLGLDSSKMPSTLADFGNTSSATIPLTMVDRLGARLREKKLRLLLCGFGVGLSWGTLACEVGPMICPPLVEV